MLSKTFRFPFLISDGTHSHLEGIVRNRTVAKVLQREYQHFARTVSETGQAGERRRRAEAGGSGQWR